MAHVFVVPAPTTAKGVAANSTWCFSPDAESEITTLAAWCKVKQQQREPLETTSKEDDDASSEDELLNGDGGHALTIDPAVLTTDGTKLIKEDFLDRLAEMLCREKKPSFIASTGMVEEGEGVTIVAARNEATWTAMDIQLMEELATIMERLSSDGLANILAP